MANIKAETQLSFTTRGNTYNDITKAIESNINTNNNNEVVEQNLSNDSTSRLFIVRPVDENMLGNPFNVGGDQIKHPQIKFHQRQTYVQPPVTTHIVPTPTQNIQTDDMDNRKSSKSKRSAPRVAATINGGRRKMKSRSPSKGHRGKKNINKYDNRRAKTARRKKATSKKIFHRGVWLIVPTAGNNFPITKEKNAKRGRRRRKGKQSSGGKFSKVIPPPSTSKPKGEQKKQRPEWNNSPLLREKDYGNRNRSKSPENSPQHLKVQGKVASSAKRRRDITNKSVKQSPILQHSMTLNSTQTTHISMTELGEDGPLRLSYDDENNTINNRSSYESILSESLLSASYISNSNKIIENTPQQGQQVEEEEGKDFVDKKNDSSEVPRLNKSISPRISQSSRSSKKTRMNVSIDIPIEGQDNRHALPFTPANIVSKHKKKKRSKWKKSSSNRNVVRTSNNSNARNVIDALDLHEDEDSMNVSTMSKQRSSKKRSVRKNLSSSTRSARSSGGYLRRSNSSPLSQSARRSASPSNDKRGSTPTSSNVIYEKARLEVEKLIKKQKTYLEAQAKITLNEIKQQQQNPNTFLDKSINSVNNLRNMIFPLVREAEEILLQAQNKSRKSHFIYNNAIMNILAKKSATLIGDNIDTLVDMVLDSVIDDTCMVLNDNEELERERKRREELPLLLAQARKEVTKLEMIEDDIVNKVNQRLLFEEDLCLNDIMHGASYKDVANDIGSGMNDVFDTNRNKNNHTTMDISETGVRIDGSGAFSNGFRTIGTNIETKSSFNGMRDQNKNELFPGVNIPVTRREKELIIKRQNIMKELNKGLAYHDVVDIETNRERFISHLNTKEHGLHDTGLNQTQIIELLEQDIIMNLVNDVAGEFDTILGNAAGTLMENV